VACPEEIAYRMGFINSAQLELLANKYLKNGYGEYLRQVLTEQVF
jgi:glucose-1-phosphate thymidylyltransferase